MDRLNSKYYESDLQMKRFSGESPNSNYKCNYLRSNLTIFTDQFAGWESIPEGLIINIIICSLLIIILAIVRCRVNRTQHLRTDKNESWFHYIYGDQRNIERTKLKTKKKKLINRKHRLAYLPSLLHDYEQQVKNSQAISVRMPKTSEESVKDGTQTASKSETKLEAKSSEEQKDKDKSENAVIEVKEDYSEFESPDDDVVSLYVDETEDETNKEGDKEVKPSSSDTQVKEPETQETQSQVSQSDDVKLIDKKRKDSDITVDTQLSIFFQRKHWLKEFLFIKDSDIMEYKGSDALQYLLFQRYIIYFMIALTVFCMAIILPINLQGDSVNDMELFGKTTIRNLGAGSDLYWVHIAITLIILAMGIYLMFHFSRVIQSDEQRVDKRILLIQGIPEAKRKKEILIDYLQNKFTGVIIKRIHFVYDIRHLDSLKNNLKTAKLAKHFCVEYQQNYGERCEVRPYCFGRFGGCCGCCSCCPKIDGIKYYDEYRRQLKRDIKKEVTNTIAQPKESVFVVFKTKDMAAIVYNHFKRKQKSLCCCRCWGFYLFWFLRYMRSFFLKQYRDVLQTFKWRAFYAPFPEDVEWKDIAIERNNVLIWNIGIHLILFLIFMFLSTPAIVVKGIEYVIFRGIEQNYSRLLLPYLSPLLLMLMTIILPGIIILASHQIPYRTISALNHAIMWKVYFFLLLMVLILPSLGLMTTSNLIERMSKENATAFTTDCLFPSESSSFFVNYVLQAAFLANTFEIMRVPELALYFLCTLVFSRSVAEHETARQKVSFDFTFGSKYPRFLLLFTIIVTYSVASPLITPCGLFYMVGKHLVDRYNIVYVYMPTKINSRIHSTAVLYVHFALLFVQIQLTAVMNFRGSDAQKFFSNITLSLSVFFVIIHVCYLCCKTNDE